MNLNTTSEIISFSKQLEQESSKIYKDLVSRFPENEDIFLSLIKENEKNVDQIQRAYYGVISDAFEGCFSFNITPSRYSFKNEFNVTESIPEILERTIRMEEKIEKFYLDAAEQSQSLMADVPRTFKIVAKKRAKRQVTLRELINKTHCD